MYIICIVNYLRKPYDCFPPAHMPFSMAQSVHPKRPRLAPTRWLGPQFLDCRASKLTFWEPQLGGAVGFINGSNYGNKLHMLGYNSYKYRLSQSTYLFLFLPKPNNLD